MSRARPHAAVLALVLVALSGSVAAHAQTFAKPMYADRFKAEQLARDEIGRDYACAVVTRRTEDRPRRLLIYVTSTEAVPQAKSIRARLRHPERTGVRVVAQRFRERKLERIRQFVLAHRPHVAQSWIVALESPLNRARCPRVEITLLPRGEASARLEDWASRMRERFGSDRVVIRRGPAIRPDA
jgi:hypothetical protein